MTLMMEIECGTYRAQKFEIDLDDYGKREKSYGSDQKKAYDLLRSTLDDETFMDDGYRNDDAVNSLIALHVLGYDAGKWMENFLVDMKGRRQFFNADINKFEEHVERVLPYLGKWGPKGHECKAMDFAII